MSGISRLCKTFFRVSGPDSARFLNGLFTNRLVPNVVKKKQHTISENEQRHADLAGTIDVSQNWGAMHEDIYDPDQNIYVRRDGIFGMFLNSKGRVVNDYFCYPTPFHTASTEFQQLLLAGPNYLIEVDSKYSSSLFLYLRIHKLSAKVKIEKQLLFSYYYYNDDLRFDEWLDDVQQKYLMTSDPASALETANSLVTDGLIISPEHSSKVVGFAVDNRIPNFGVKVVTSEELTSPVSLFSESFRDEYSPQNIPEKQITSRRIVNGVFETADAPNGHTMLPFEANLDYVNGLSLDKGCYVGQELTIRTYNGGVVRKRILPVYFQENLSSVFEGMDLATVDISRPALDNPIEEVTVSSPFGSASKPRRGKLAKLLTVQDSVGFMLVSVDEAKKDPNFVARVGNVEYPLIANIPDWWPEDQ